MSQEKKITIIPIKGFVGVLAAVLAIFLVFPLFLKSYYSHLCLQGTFILMVFYITHSMNQDSLALLIGGALVLLFLAFDVLSILNDSLVLMLTAYFFYCLFLFLAITVLSKNMLISHYIDTNLIFGAVTVYLLVGICWSKIYFLIDAFFENSFHGLPSLDIYSDGIKEGYQVQFDLLYYSFTTLSTLGVGDIAPIHRLAKSMTMLEAIFGQLFVATFITKMVSTWHHQE